MLTGLRSAVRGIRLPRSVFIMYGIAIETGAGQEPGDHVVLTCWLSPSLCSMNSTFPHSSEKSKDHACGVQRNT